MKTANRIALLAFAAGSLAASGALAADAALEAAVAKVVGTQSWLGDSTVTGALKAQNEQSKALDQAKINELDEQWKAAAKAGANPAYDKIAANATSKHLADIVAKSDGRIVEILLMDDKGLNAAQTDKTSDYWQGDEAKWQKVFTDGAKIYVADPETDEKTKVTLTEVSVPVTDAGGAKLGVAMIVMDVAKLGM